VVRPIRSPEEPSRRPDSGARQLRGRTATYLGLIATLAMTASLLTDATGPLGAYQPSAGDMAAGGRASGRSQVAGASANVAVGPETYLKASNTGNGDRFGSAIDISGDTLVVGAPLEESRASGVGGDQSDNSRIGAGAAYVFVKTGAGWIQQAYLKSGTPKEDGEFGTSVAIDGDTIVIGAPFETIPGRYQSGKAYIYQRTGSSWALVLELNAHNAGDLDGFGTSVAIDDGLIVIGAPSEDSDATGVGGDWTSDRATSAGAAYVYQKVGPDWVFTHYLKASNTDAYDRFGRSVSVSGSTIAVGAPGESSGARGIDGNQSDDGADEAGAAYVFVRDGFSWAQQAYIKASNADWYDSFGIALSLAGDRLAAGAPGESSKATGVNGNGENNGAYESGAAYVFVRSGSTWTQEAYVKPLVADEGDGFGWQVALENAALLVGTSRESSRARGVNGDASDNRADEAGAAWLFTRAGGAWSQSAYIKASNSSEYQRFASSIAIGPDLIAIGAPSEESSARGVDGDRFDFDAPGSGAAYVRPYGEAPVTTDIRVSPSRPTTGRRLVVSASVVDVSGVRSAVVRLGPGRPSRMRALGDTGSAELAFRSSLRAPGGASVNVCVRATDTIGLVSPWSCRRVRLEPSWVEEAAPAPSASLPPEPAVPSTAPVTTPPPNA